MMANRIMIDILPVSLFILFLFGIKFERPLSSFNTEGYLSLETGNFYRGFFAIVVVLHHLSQRTETGIVFRYFAMAGYLAVAFFFFVSGYGLQKSFIKKKDNYKKGFLLKRLPSVLIPYIIITFFYWLMHLVGGKLYSLKAIIISIVGGYPIVDNSWYIINILIFYVVYWLLMLSCRKKYFLMILGGTVWYFLYAFFCVKMGYGSWWYNASQLLIVGMFWATYENKILEILKKYYAIIAPITWIAFFAIIAFHGKITALAHIPSVVLKAFTAIFFVLSVIAFSLKAQIGNKILNFLGNISLEIYISQGLLITSLRGGHIYIENELLWCVAVIAGTVVFSYLLHIVLQAIMGKYKLLLHKHNI